MSIFSVNPEIMFSNDLFLRRASRKLNEQEVLNPNFKKIVNCMLTSLYENPIGVGLAAPQLGLQICLIVIDIKRNGKKPLVLINPEYHNIDNEMIDSKETCLSFNNYDGKVKRYKKIKVLAKNVYFEDVEFEAEGFLAIVCQHEIDHLNGKVYVDKATEFKESENRYKMLSNEAIKVIYF